MIAEVMSTDVSLFELLLTTFGSSGLTVMACVVVFRAWLGTLKEKDSAQTQRIVALEQALAKATDDCAKDRAVLHQQLQVLSDRLLNTLTTVVEDNTEVLRQIKAKL